MFEVVTGRTPKTEMRPAFKNAIAALPSLPLYFAGCAMPALITWNSASRSITPVYGDLRLLLGPLGLFYGHISWLANPLMSVAAYYLIRSRYVRSMVITGVAVLLALTAAISLSLNPMPANEGGVGELRLRSFGPGFYLWICSMVALAAGAVTRMWLTRNAINSGLKTDS